MSAHAIAHRQPVWAAHRRRVPGAPADVTLHVLHLEDICSWALSTADCLTEGELSRGCAFQDSRSRELFVVSRVALRHVLAHRLGCAPHEVPISHDPRTGAPHEVHGHGATVSGSRHDGGPELATSPALGLVRPLRFSVSRTAGVIALVTAQRAVGVDVERLQSEVEANVLLDILHPADRTRLLRMRGRRRAVAVTRTWVRVEALVKGWQTGLSRDPASIHVGSAARADYGRGWSVSDVRTTAQDNARLAVAWRTDPAPQG